jgi:hypothetical protein
VGLGEQKCGNVFSIVLGSSYPARFPSCICSTMENAFPQTPRRSWVRDRGAHTGCITRTWTMSPEPARPAPHVPERESPSAEPHAQSRDHKERRPPTWFLWERIFHRTGSSYPARFPSCICSTMENAFQQKIVCDGVGEAIGGGVDASEGDDALGGEGDVR